MRRHPAAASPSVTILAGGEEARRKEKETPTCAACRMGVWFPLLVPAPPALQGGEYGQGVLERNEGNVTHAFDESGLVRSSLHKIMRKLEVDASALRKRKSEDAQMAAAKRCSRSLRAQRRCSCTSASAARPVDCSAARQALSLSRPPRRLPRRLPGAEPLDRG